MLRAMTKGCCLVMAGAVIAAVWAGVASASQPTELRLDESRRWQVTAEPEPGTDEWTIAEARRLLAEDRADGARRLLTPFIDQHEREGHPLLPEAYLVRGDALVAMDREFSALYDYEALLKRFRESEHFPTAVSRELEIALRYAAGLRIRAMGVRMADSGDAAVELLIRVQERMPRSDLAERAAIALADFYFRHRDMKLANITYDLYLQNYPRGPNRVHAMKRKIQTDIARFKGPRYDAAGLVNARVQIEDFQSRYPVEAAQEGLNDALLVRVDESIAAHLLDSAEYYLRIGDWPSARFTLQRVVRDHPLTVSSQRAERIIHERGWAEAPAAQAESGPEPGAGEGADDTDGAGVEPETGP